jgi:TRAP-type uncharacterized transport system fused permease subunit
VGNPPLGRNRIELIPASVGDLILAVLIGPALTKMGSSVLGAHLFLIYFAALSSISPPVALTVFTAAGIADADNMKAGWLSMFYALGGIILPFAFVLNENYFLHGSAASIVITIFFGIVGMVLLAGGVVGWFGRNINVVVRVVLLVAGTLIMIAKPMDIISGLVIAVIAFVLMFFTSKKNTAKETLVS